MAVGRKLVLQLYLITGLLSGAVRSSTHDNVVAPVFTKDNFNPWIESRDTSGFDSALISNLEIGFLQAQSHGQVKRQQSNDTRDDLIKGECNDVIVIFARGTGGTGNLGASLGPSFIKHIEDVLPGRVIAQGVLPYPADIIGYLQGGSYQGGEAMKNLTQRAATQCPDAQIVLSGYSQGAQVTHIAAGLIPTNLYDRISCIVTFGDPKQKEPFPGTLEPKALVLCNNGDLICEGRHEIKPQHYSEAYELRMPEAIAWIKERTSGKSNTNSSSTSTSTLVAETTVATTTTADADSTTETDPPSPESTSLGKSQYNLLESGSSAHLVVLVTILMTLCGGLGVISIH